MILNQHIYKKKNETIELSEILKSYELKINSMLQQLGIEAEETQFSKKSNS